MGHYSSLFGAIRTFTVAAGAIADADGLKTSIATSADAVTYSGTPAAAGDFNGALAAKFLKGQMPARTVSITAASATGSYSTNPVVVTGTRNGVEVTESLTPTNANGGWTVRGRQPFDAGAALSFAFPAQVDANGHWTIGLEDMYAPAGQVFRTIDVSDAGNLQLEFPVKDTDGVYVLDLVPVLAGQHRKYMAQAIRSTDNAGANPTTAGFTVGL
jgi:hypothetical protein